MTDFFSGLIDALFGIGNNVANNQQIEKLNHENIQMQKEINDKNIALQRETNFLNQNAPTSEYTQLRSLGASRVSALGALGAPQSATAPTLTAPQNAFEPKAANVDMKNLLHSFSKQVRLENEKTQSDIDATNTATANAKSQESRDSELHDETLKSVKHQNLLNTLDEEERRNLSRLYYDITNNRNFRSDMTVSQALDLLDEHDFNMVRDNVNLLRGLRSELTQDLQSSDAHRSAEDTHKSVLAQLRAAKDKHKLDEQQYNHLVKLYNEWDSESDERKQSSIARKMLAELQQTDARLQKVNLDDELSGYERTRSYHEFSKGMKNMWDIVTEIFGAKSAGDILAAAARGVLVK